MHLVPAVVQATAQATNEFLDIFHENPAGCLLPLVPAPKLQGKGPWF